MSKRKDMIEALATSMSREMVPWLIEWIRDPNMKRLTRYAGLIAGASLLTAGFGGCTGSDGGDWNNAPKMHTCTADQMAKVQAETKWCADNTTYLSTYCYGTAMIRNCQRIKTPNVKSEGAEPLLAKLPLD